MIENALRHRGARLVAVSFIILTAGFAFHPYLTSDVGTKAAVNAPLTRHIAPFDGTVALLPSAGSVNTKPVSLKLMNFSTHSGQLGATAVQIEEAGATITLLRRQLAAMAHEDRQLAQREAAVFRAAAVSAEAEVARMASASAACQTQLRQALALAARIRQLQTAGFATDAQQERADAEVARAGAECGMTASDNTKAAAALRAVRERVLIDRSANDQPYSTQQRDRLRAEMRQAEARLVEAVSRRDALTRRLLIAQDRATVLLPANTVTWAIHARPGTAVVAGAPVLDIADCRRRFVDVSLPERRAAAIDPGGRALIRLVGTRDWIEGRITRLSGAAARTDTTLLAAAPLSEPGDREVIVKVAISSTAETSNGSSGCDIGRLAEVRLSRFD